MEERQKRKREDENWVTKEEKTGGKGKQKKTGKERGEWGKEGEGGEEKGIHSERTK
jgi:hypothetical protein